jgi:hypothetical protein
MFRQLFCAHNAAELDELLHANPIYRKPERRTITTQRSPSNYSAINPLVSSSNLNIGKYDYLINRPEHFLSINPNIDSASIAVATTSASYKENLSPII